MHPATYAGVNAINNTTEDGTMKARKPTTKDIGKVVTVIRDGVAVYTGMYNGRCIDRRPGWFDVDGRQFHTRNSMVAQ